MLTVIAMGVILYFTRTKVDTLTFYWATFCLGLLALYFIIIEVKKALKNKQSEKK